MSIPSDGKGGTAQGLAYTLVQIFQMPSEYNPHPAGDGDTGKTETGLGSMNLPGLIMTRFGDIVRRINNHFVRNIHGAIYCERFIPTPEQTNLVNW